MIGHLGSQASALLDGRLDADEAERAWAHVHLCHACRDLVEREGWVKNRLARLSEGPRVAPASLKGSILDAPGEPVAAGRQTGWAPGVATSLRPSRRGLGLGSMGGSVVGVAVVGVLAMGTAAPANAPGADRRGLLTQPAPTLPTSTSDFTPASRTALPRR